MFCPKCGTQTSDESNSCAACGFDFSEVQCEKGPDSSSQLQSNVDVIEKKPIPVKTIVFFTLAAVVLIMFLIASFKVSNGGSEIMQIQSVGGKTLEEAYYFQLGQIYAGYALTIRAMGVFCASVLVYLGLKK